MSMRGIVVVLACLLQVCGAHAEEVRVYAAGAVQKAIQALIPAFEASSGHTIVATYDTVGALAGRVRAGDKPDLLIVSASAMSALADAALVERAAVQALGRTGVGLAGATDKAAPDISTSDALKAALLAAPSIVHADPARGATAGTHFAKVLRDLGIAETLKARITVIPFGGAVAGDVAAGKFAIGVSQASEIVPNPNVRFLGFLPEPHALWTIYSIAPVTPSTAATRAFLARILGPEGTRALTGIGFQR